MRARLPPSPDPPPGSGEKAIEDTNARLAEDSDDVMYIEVMQRSYWSQISIQPGPAPLQYSRQGRQAVPWRHWSLCRWLPPPREWGCSGRHCTHPPTASLHPCQMMSPRTIRRMSQPLVGDHVNAAAAETMKTRIPPHSLASPVNRSP